MDGGGRQRQGRPAPRGRHLIVVLVVMVLSSPVGGVKLASSGPGRAAAARLLVVDSYHRGYPWGDGIRAGLTESLDLLPAGPDSFVRRGDLAPLTARVLYLDTKRNPDPRWSVQAARRALDALEAWRPDVVVASDDNAVRDLVSPHLLGRDLPVIYCGVNWDAGVYGLPAANCTGMVEVEQVPDLVAVLRPHAAGDRVGLLVLDTTSGRRDAEIYGAAFDLDLTVRLVADYAAWKQAFAALQDEVDMLLIKQNVTGDPDWDLDDAVAFAMATTRIPTGTTTEPTMRCVLVAFIKSAREQGHWAAGAVQAVLDGTAPAAIPPAVNRESRVFLNMTLARQLGVRFPMTLIERATFLEEAWEP